MRSRGWGGRAAVWMAPIQTMAWSCICQIGAYCYCKSVLHDWSNPGETRGPAVGQVCCSNMTRRRDQGQLELPELYSNDWSKA